MHPRRGHQGEYFFTAKAQRTQREDIFCFLLRGQKAKRLNHSVIIIFLSFSVFLMSCASITSVSKPLDATPTTHLAFEELVYDFGVAGPQQTITHTFKFTNVGSVPLKISGLTTSCGCTAALLSGPDIPLGSGGGIQATFETKRYEGKQETTITVHSNDPDEPQIDLTIKGNIKRDVAVVPQGLSFGDVKKGEVVTGQVRMLQLSDQLLVLKRIEADERYLMVAASRFRDENSRGLNIEITLKPQVPSGPFSDVITLHTNVKKRPRIDVPVWANVVDEPTVNTRQPQ